VIYVSGKGLIDLRDEVWGCYLTELKGATPDILQRLIPERARKQNPMLAL
jgi:hypothetical protein